LGGAFPEGFLWGVAVSSFQVEMGRGAVADGSDWWAWVHDEENKRRKWVSGDSPADGPGFWELYSQDYRLARGLGCNAFRLSLDWARVFTTSTEGVAVEVHRDRYGNIEKVRVDDRAMRELARLADKASVRRYRQILSECRVRGMEPMVTLYHWPIPLWLHDPIATRDGIAPLGKRGWMDEGTLVEFAKYCAYAAHVFGDLVDLWGTINEVKIVSDHGFLDGGEFPPGMNDFGVFMIAMRHLSMAHGLAYEQVKRWDRASAGPLGPSRVGIVAVLHYHEPVDPASGADVRATIFNDYLFNEWSLNAVFRGDYDMNVDGLVEGDEMLPHLVKGCDWIGVNYYMRRRVRYEAKGGDIRLDYAFAPAVDPSDIGFDTYPEGLRWVCDWAYSRYRRPIYVTENGIADASDSMRERYLLGHLDAVQRAIELDGVPVRGYFHWSLIDNLELSSGYKVRFGLCSVDAMTKRRTPKASAEVFKRIAEANMLP
jgi:beta-galactosidase